jgi:hypothetical protein
LPVYAEDDRKMHSYYVACQNSAGDISETKTITYFVDFSALGGIISTSPSGAISNTTVELKVITSKDAMCRYKDGAEWKSFNATGQTKHTSMKILKEGSYLYPVECVINENNNLASGNIKFIVDISPPKMVSVDDGNVSCGDRIWPVFNSKDDYSSVKYYQYAIYDSNKTMIAGWTLANSSNPEVILPPLLIGKSYYFEVYAIDEAGLKSNQSAKSDGFTADYANATDCRLDKTPPDVRLEKETTYKGVKVTIICTDQLGCASKYYSISSVNESCNASSLYTEPFYLKKTSTVCYKAADVAGNIATGSEIVSVEDEDGDGVPDEKDNCPDTPAEEEVDTEGCSGSQKHGDQDKDGVRDDMDACLDTPLEEINEVDKDPGSKWYGCSPSQRDKDKDGIPDEADKCLDTPAGEAVDKNPASKWYGCSDSQKDSDEDGMDDAWEIKQGLNPNDSGDANIDTDGDGLTNLEEYKYYKITGKIIYVNKKDTDGDGWNDKEEIDSGSDPTDSESIPGKKSRAVPITFLILGLLLLLFGFTYTIYIKYTHEEEKGMQKPLTEQQRRMQQQMFERQRQLAEQQRRAAEIARRLEAERGKKVIERVAKLREEREKKRGEFFKAFGEEKEKPAVPVAAKILPKLEKEKIAEAIKPAYAKEKDVFEKLLDLAKERAVKGKSAESVLKLVKVPEEHAAEFEKLSKLIEEKTKKYTAADKKEMPEYEKEEIKDIFYKLYLFAEKQRAKEKLGKLKQQEAFEELRKVSRHEKPADVFEKLKELGLKKRKIK